MKTIKVRGIVLREYEAGESDKRLLLLCKGRGRLFVYARGARNPKSKFIAAAQLFTYADFVLAEGRGFYSLAQAEPIESFYNLRTDYDALCCAHVITEINERTVLEEENCDELLQLTLKALAYLAGLNKKTPAIPPLHVLAVFMLRFFMWYGVAPSMDACFLCASETFTHPRLSPEGILCGDHPTQNEHIPLTAAGIIAMRYIFAQPLATAFHFTATPKVIHELQKATHMMWRHHFDTDLRSYYLTQTQPARIMP
ncbi:MAG: DNA repair protein RecO [Defluviitaleaceae bacterium]|nr:DNA repair protein RecO [Defluviitaleaceae bacterium]